MAGPTVRVTVTIEYRLERTPDGAVWTGASFAYPFWSRYLEVFDSVLVLARLRPVAEPRPDARRADGDRVEFAPMPYYVGSLGFVRRWRRLRTAVGAALRPDDAVIMRLPSPVAAAVMPELAPERPFGVEVVGDPHEALAPGAMRDVARPLARRLLTRQVARLCRRAAAVAYVTAGRQQRRYPASPTAYTTHYSSIDLDEGDFAAAPRRPPPPGEPVQLVTVASLETPYKGVDVLLDAARVLVADGRNVKVLIVGDGRQRSRLEQHAARRGLGGRVEFRGELPAGAPVRAALDESDLFVMASRSEGLPRALVEAMARGLPCVGTTAGGIPELLDQSALARPGDPAALAGAIRRMLDDPAAMAAAATRNQVEARAYLRPALQARRRDFYATVAAATSKWLDEEEAASESSS